MFNDEIICYIPDITWEYMKAYWTSQRKEIKRHNESVYKIYQDFVELFIEGCQVSFNSERMKTLSDPHWLDPDMIKRGQEFAKCYYSSICYANLISLYLLFGHDRSLRSLIYTKKSNDVESAFKRYMSTIHRVKSWYEHDMTDLNSPARKHIQTVNNYHLSVSSRLNSMTEEEFVKSTTLTEELTEKDNTSYERIQKMLVENKIELHDELIEMIDTGLHVSQSHMIMTQFGFMGLVVLYPHKFGIDGKSDFISFIHVWRYIGYLLGIEDKYNLCSGSIDEVFHKCKAVLECIFKPFMFKMTPHWEHMSICAFKGVNKAINFLDYEASLAFLLDCMELEFNHFYKSMKLSSKVSYHLTKFGFSYVIPFHGIREKINRTLDAMLEKEKHFSTK